MVFLVGTVSDPYPKKKKLNNKTHTQTQQQQNCSDNRSGKKKQGSQNDTAFKSLMTLKVFCRLFAVGACGHKMTRCSFTLEPALIKTTAIHDVWDPNTLNSAAHSLQQIVRNETSTFF